MRGRVAAAAALATAVVCCASAFAVSRSAPYLVTLDGVGGVVPGMTPAQVSRIWGVPVTLGPDVASPGCQEAVIRAGRVHGYALFLSGRFGAVWFDRGARTPSGITIGSTVPQLVRAYDTRYGMYAKPHTYVIGGQYFFLTRQQSPHWKLRFDSNASARITQIGFGNDTV